MAKLMPNLTNRPATNPADPRRQDARPDERPDERIAKPGSRRLGRHFTQRGIALIAVAVAMAVAGVIVTEFSTSTNVDMFAASNIEADMKAHFLARSGVNLAQLVVKVQTDVVDGLNQQLKTDIQLGDYVGLLMGAFGGSKEEVESLAALIGGFQADNIKGLGVPEGSFDVTITTDDGKINLNCAGDRTGNAQKTLIPKLKALFYFDAYDPIFQNEDAEGWRRNRNQQIESFLDYVDPDRVKYDADNEQISSAPEDYGYESLSDKYEAKNNYMDTVGEIKLIRGVDDRLWSLFGNNFTVYGGCKENLGAISDPKQLASIIFLAAKNPEDPVLRDPQKLWALAKYVADARSMGMFFASTDDFLTFVKDPLGGLAGLAGMLGGDLGNPADVLASQTGGVQIEGVELDKAKLDSIVTAGARRTYRIEALATYGNLSKRIVGVWDKDVTKQNMRDPNGDRKGAWVFWREE